MIKFHKAETWQCQKCNQTLAIRYEMGTPEEDVFTQILAVHKKASMDCTSPSGFKHIGTFLKHEETK